MIANVILILYNSSINKLKFNIQYCQYCLFWLIKIEYQINKLINEFIINIYKKVNTNGKNSEMSYNILFLYFEYIFPGIF